MNELRGFYLPYRVLQSVEFALLLQICLILWTYDYYSLLPIWKRNSDCLSVQGVLQYRWRSSELRPVLSPWEAPCLCAAEWGLWRMEKENDQVRTTEYIDSILYIFLGVLTFNIYKNQPSKMGLIFRIKYRINLLYKLPFRFWHVQFDLKYYLNFTCVKTYKLVYFRIFTHKGFRCIQDQLKLCIINLFNNLSYG